MADRRDLAPAPPAHRPATAAAVPPETELGRPGPARGPAPRDTQTGAPRRAAACPPRPHPSLVKFMTRDRGSNYTAAFDAVLADAGIRTVLCNVETPRMNAIADSRT